MSRESSLVYSIMRYLKTVPGCKAEKRHGSVYATKGAPDISGALHGVRFEIEAKQEGNAPTALQHEQLAQWSDAGCWCLVADNLDAVKRMIKTMEQYILSISGPHTAAKSKQWREQHGYQFNHDGGHRDITV